MEVRSERKELCLANEVEVAATAVFDLLNDRRLTLSERKILEGALVVLLRIRNEVLFHAQGTHLNEDERLQLKQAAKDTDQCILNVLAFTPFNYLSDERQSILEEARKVAIRAYKRFRKDSDDRDEYDYILDEIQKLLGGDLQ